MNRFTTFAVCATLVPLSLRGQITGSGTTNYIPKFTGSTSIGNSAIYQSGGNVGIGTTSPVVPLQVNGKISVGSNVTSGLSERSLNLVDINAVQRIWRWTTNTSMAPAVELCWGTNPAWGAQGNYHWDFFIATQYSGGFGIRDRSYGANDAIRLFISNTGAVGIGTINPAAYKLAVKGSIRAEEVVVETGWSDFVFEEDYPLMPLSDLEQHIKARKHLPGIPPESEIAKDGVKLGEMQSKLLQKIEELTLYIIDLRKEIDQLKTKD